ncbi:MAG: hypothetical protein C5B49_00540 [Bdellovibrio sp.]|nr:MAG: hypothetical protein C5B49_00540 [Bdellovibrio sp.]
MNLLSQIFFMGIVFLAQAVFAIGGFSRWRTAESVDDFYPGQVIEFRNFRFDLQRFVPVKPGFCQLVVDVKRGEDQLTIYTVDFDSELAGRLRDGDAISSDALSGFDSWTLFDFGGGNFGYSDVGPIPHQNDTPYTPILPVLKLRFLTVAQDIEHGPWYKAQMARYQKVLSRPRSCSGSHG